MVNEFQKDLTYLRKAFPPMAKDWNVNNVEESLRFTRDLHGWEAYARAEKAEASGNNASKKTILAPAVGFLRYVYACSAFFNGGGPLDLNIFSNRVGLASGVGIVDDQMVTVPRPILLTSNDDLEVEVSAPTGAGNSLKIQALFIDFPDVDYIWPV